MSAAVSATASMKAFGDSVLRVFQIEDIDPVGHARGGQVGH